MRDFLKSSGRRLRAGWFWPLVLLALPNCAIQDIPGLPPPTVDHGPNPTSTVMCDIPKFTESVQCATTDLDLKSGTSMSAAAVSLSETKQGFVGLDYSKAGRDQCGGTNPVKVEFFGEFPDGFQVCLDCNTQIPKVYTDGNDVCRAQCEELIFGQPIRPGDPFAYCADTTRVHVSTNFNKNVCYDNTCDSNGQPLANFKTNDPRRPQEPVSWVTQNGTKNGATGNNLTRTAGRSGNFDAGAFSKQTLTKGDGWVEFEVSDSTAAYALGLSSGASDGSELSDTIDFAILLQGGNVFISQKGSLAGPLGTPYQVGERFRVQVVDNNDSANPSTETATVSAYRLNGPCAQGTECTKTNLSPANVSVLTYPLRVDASLVDPIALLVNVALVRIQDLP